MSKPAPKHIKFEQMDFTSAEAALIFLELLRYKRLPVPGLVKSWVGTEYDDDGNKMMVIARSALGPCPDTGEVTVGFRYYEAPAEAA